MDDSRLTLGAITLFVSDRDRAREFYARLLENEPVFEDESSAAFALGNVIINLLARTNADELIAPASVASSGAGADALLTIDVSDVDAAVARLAGKGIRMLNGPMDRPWGVRTAAFADPDGHAWELAAKIDE